MKFINLSQRDDTAANAIKYCCPGHRPLPATISFRIYKIIYLPKLFPTLLCPPPGSRALHPLCRTLRWYCKFQTPQAADTLDLKHASPRCASSSSNRPPRLVLLLQERALASGRMDGWVGVGGCGWGGGGGGCGGGGGGGGGVGGGGVGAGRPEVAPEVFSMKSC